MVFRNYYLYVWVVARTIRGQLKVVWSLLFLRLVNTVRRAESCSGVSRVTCQVVVVNFVHGDCTGRSGVLQFTVSVPRIW